MARYQTTLPILGGRRTCSVGLVLAALVAVGFISAADAQQRDSSKEFGRVSADGNIDFIGIWEDGTTMWAAQHDGEIYAYHMSNKSRDSSKDFRTPVGINPTGLWSDGTTMWVADNVDGKIYAYYMNGTHDPDKDFTLSAGRLFPTGLWSDGTTMWVANLWDNKIYAYNMSDKQHDPLKDSSTLSTYGNIFPSGIWSDGATMWVARHESTIYAYNISDWSRDSSKDFNTLSDAGNNNPAGLWSNGTTMWVADIADRKIYAYKMPSSTSSSTQTGPPPVAPANLQASSTTNTVTLTWDDPSDSTITGYKILSRATATQTELSVLVNNTGSAATSYTISNLNPNTNYAFRIVALSDNGESQISDYASISTKRLPPPAAPANLQANSTTNTVTLTWDNPSDSTITGYKILSRATATQTELSVLVDDTGSTATSYTISNLNPNTNYAFRIVALNDNGESLISDYASISTKRLPPPAAPANLQASSTTNTVTLTWDNPSDSTITGYKILSRATATQTELIVLVNNTGSAATSYTISNLNPNTNYAFRIIAFSDNGESQISDYANISTKRLPPPANLQANSTINTVTLTWDDPSDSTITGYKILSRATATQTELSVLVADTGSVSTSYTISNLNPNTNYVFRVVAFNDNGESGSSDPAAISTKRLPPPANLQANSTTNTVTLTWDNPSDSTITGYKILSRATATQTELSVLVADTGSVSTSYTISNLNPNTNYAFRVVAFSDNGESGPSNPTAISTKRLPPPAAPANLQANSTTNTVTLTWDDPGDSTITGYKILSRATATQTEITVLVADTGSATNSYTVYSLEPDTNYAFRIIALSDQGESQISHYVSIATLPDG